MWQFSKTSKCNKKHKDSKGRNQTIIQTIIWCMENTTEYAQILKLISKFSKVAGYKVTIP